jgi:hypothetical protein
MTPAPITASCAWRGTDLARTDERIEGLPDGRPLPAVCAQRCRGVAIGNRGGIGMSGVPRGAPLELC